MTAQKKEPLEIATLLFIYPQNFLDSYSCRHIEIPYTSIFHNFSYTMTTKRTIDDCCSLIHFMNGAVNNKTCHVVIIIRNITE